jgi:predicted Fe-S protein YdhL (DUF1289 family)
MNPATGLCVGCQRTIDEIATWGGLDDEARRAVWVRLRERRARAGAMRAPPATPDLPSR